MMPIKLLLALVAVLLVSACAIPSSQIAQPAGPNAKCEDVVAEGLAAREAEAKKIAKEGINQQLADARGNLLALGLRRIRGVAYETRCRPHTLGLGLTKCTAVARLCGR